MRVLCVSAYYKPAYIYGGPARSIPLLCESLARQGADVTVYTTNANGNELLDVPLHTPVEMDGVKVHYFPISGMFPRRYFYSSELGKACRNEIQFFDIIYICGSWVYEVITAARAAYQAGIPYVISPRGSFMEWSINQKRIKKLFYLNLIQKPAIQQAAMIHYTSFLEAEQTAQFGFKPPICVIPNGVNQSRGKSKYTWGSLRKKYGIAPDFPVTLFVGRLHKLKRINRMIDVFSLVKRDIPDAHLMIVGEDEDGSGAFARSQAALLRIEDSVHFTGLLRGDDISQAYVDADLLVLFSHAENFSMVAVEAISMGLPVLLSDRVGVAREITQAQAGFIVDVDTDQAAIKWKELLRDPGLREKMGLNGRHLSETIFNPDNLAINMLERFEAISFSSLKD